jgi:hypothetical protein
MPHPPKKTKDNSKTKAKNFSKLNTLTYHNENVVMTNIYALNV